MRGVVCENELEPLEIQSGEGEFEVELLLSLAFRAAEQKRLFQRQNAFRWQSATFDALQTGLRAKVDGNCNLVRQQVADLVQSHLAARHADEELEDDLLTFCGPE